jgi:hypothetical protein
MSYHAICDRCGEKRWNYDLRKEWTGLRVCKFECWEPRHPQEAVRGRPDKQNPPWVKPEPADVFVWGHLLHEDGSPYLREENEGGGAIIRENFSPITHDP